jgi:hypothetical protein
MYNLYLATLVTICTKDARGIISQRHDDAREEEEEEEEEEERKCYLTLGRQRRNSIIHNSHYLSVYLSYLESAGCLDTNG